MGRLSRKKTFADFNHLANYLTCKMSVLTVKLIKNCSRLYLSTSKVKPSITLVTPDPVLLVTEFHILVMAYTTVGDQNMMKSTVREVPSEVLFQVFLCTLKISSIYGNNLKEGHLTKAAVYSFSLLLCLFVEHNCTPSCS